MISELGQNCSCGWVALPLNQPEPFLFFEQQQNFFFIESPDGGFFPIYYCPFCGGKFPDSSKPVWAPFITSEERTHFETIINSVSNVDELIKRLGPPSYDVVDSGGTRKIEYYNLSEVAQIECMLGTDGCLTCKLGTKRVSPRHKRPGEI